MKTGSVAGDITVAILFTTLWCLACGAGVIVVPFIYTGAQKVYPIYARAMGWTYVVALLVMLGAFCQCLATAPPM